MALTWLSLVAETWVSDGFEGVFHRTWPHAWSRHFFEKVKTPSRVESLRFVLCFLWYAPCWRVHAGISKTMHRSALRIGDPVQAVSSHDSAVVGCAAAAVMSDLLDMLTERPTLWTPCPMLRRVSQVCMSAQVGNCAILSSCELVRPKMK